MTANEAGQLSILKTGQKLSGPFFQFVISKHYLLLSG